MLGVMGQRFRYDTSVIARWKLGTFEVKGKGSYGLCRRWRLGAGLVSEYMVINRMVEDVRISVV